MNIGSGLHPVTDGHKNNAVRISYGDQEGDLYANHLLSRPGAPASEQKFLRKVSLMNQYTIIAGVNGTGKSSLRGVLEGQGVNLGQIIDPDQIAKKNRMDTIKAGRQALLEIDSCLRRNSSFTQETTLSGHRIEKNLQQARRQGYYIVLYYIGLSSAQERLLRIENRVRKGGHNIPSEDVKRRFSNRWEDLKRVFPYCDEVIFYDNENGFVKVAEYKNSQLNFTGNYRPNWLDSFLNTL